MLSILETIVTHASRYIYENYVEGKGSEVISRREDDVTREIDMAVEELVYRMLRDNVSEGGVLYAEEGGVYQWGNNRYIFVLDPLDGSLNYALAVPFFAVSLAAGTYREGTLSDLEYAVVSIPTTGELYTASPEVGARKNGKALKRKSGNIVFVALSNGFPDVTCEILKKTGYRGRSLGSSAAELLYTVEGKAVGFVDLRGKLRVLDIAGALTFGKYVPGFKYVKYGGDTPNARVSIIAGSEDFVNAATS